MKSKAWNDLTIRLFDIVLAFVGIIITMPLLMVSLLLSALLIGFPPLYSSKRKGKDGVVFSHVKIKSMLPGKEVGRIFFEKERLNPAGQFLRATHFDELTELFHILSGRMSFVGPRPLLLNVLEILDTGTRELVQPGWTGLAQVWLLKKGTLNKYTQIRMDNYYVSKRSLAYNIMILAATVRYILRGRKLDLSPNSTPDRIKFRNNDFKYK